MEGDTKKPKLKHKNEQPPDDDNMEFDDHKLLECFGDGDVKSEKPLDDCKDFDDQKLLECFADGDIKSEEPLEEEDNLDFDDKQLLESFGDGGMKSEEIKDSIKIDKEKEFVEDGDDDEVQVIDTDEPEKECPVEDLCEFECHVKKCSYKTKHFANLLVHHTWRVRGSTIDHYKGKIVFREDITRLACKIKYCLCKVCGVPVLNDHTVVQFHIYQSHGKMMLKDYEKIPLPKQRNETFLHQGIKLTKCNVVISEVKGTEELRREILKESTQSFNHIELAKKFFTCQGGLARKSFLPATSLRDDDTTEEVADICLFSCQYCDLKTSNYGKYRCHHCFTRDGKKLLLHSECIIRYHNCCICSKKIPCSTDSIRAHVTVHENGKYRELDKYMTLAMERRKKVNNSGNFTTSVPDMSHITKVFKVPFEQSHLIPENSVGYKVRNLCEFTCDMCSFRTTVWCSLNIHKKAEHKKVLLCKEKYIVKARYHACNICAKRLLSGIHFIAQHALLVHSMTTSEYETFTEEVGPVCTMYEKNGKMFAKCKLCYTDFFLQNQFTTFNHMHQSHEDIIVNYSKKLQTMKNKVVASAPSAIPHDSRSINNRSIKVATSALKIKLESERLAELRSQVPLVSSPPLGFCSMPEDSIPKSKTTDIIDNLCIFGCTKCNFRVDKWETMSRHLKRCVKFIKFKTDYLVEARYHRCLICSKPMLCDKIIIRLHASRHDKDQVEGTVYSEIERFRNSKILDS